jgi:uncharacterized protein YsxB (DUF464 family)
MGINFLEDIFEEYNINLQLNEIENNYMEINQLYNNYDVNNIDMDDLDNYQIDFTALENNLNSVELQNNNYIAG